VHEPRTFRVVDVAISAAPFADVLSRVLSAPVTGERLTIHFATAHSIVEAHEQPRLRAALAEGLVVPDGMPVTWLGRRAGLPVERVCGPDFLPALVERGVPEGRTHYFFGGAPGVPEALAARLAARFPGMRVSGTMSPPYRSLSSEEDDAIIEQINNAKPDYVWVGLGAPKQDLWVAEHRPRLRAAALLAVGAAFDFHAGTLRRAPRWMQRTGTEWIFRLFSEPRRLAGRYTRVNIRFVRMVLADWHRGTGARKPSGK
jgi:N-acetylglucosaminyldiphosphoundecaprenol N-acetyl-beta-D-mannosaminyltransferase